MKTGWRGMVVAGMALAVWSVAAAEEQPIAAVQAFLKEQRLYSGPVDGMASPATAGAVRRYQILHGFRATGLLDEPTLASMLAPAPRSAQLTESDRALLRELETVQPPPPVAEEHREPIPPAPPTPAPSPQATPSKSKRGASARSAQRPRPERVKPARISRGLVGD